MDEQIKNAAVKKSKKLLWKIIFAICTSSVFLWMLLFIVIIAFIMATAEAINQKNNSDESVVWSEKVLKYEDEIAEYCATYDIGAYKYHIMAIMQVSTDGEGKDPMAASDIAGYEIKSSKDKLQEKAMALATRVYEEAAKQQQSANTEEANDTSSNNNDSDVHEAEYEEK